MSLLTPILSGNSSFTLPIIFTASYSSSSTILLNGGGVVQIADNDFASFSAFNGDIEIKQNGKYRITFNAYSKVNMSHTSGFGNFTFLCGSTAVYTIQKNYAASSFLADTLPLWFWYNRATSTLLRTSPVASTNSGYNFEGTLMKTHEQVMTRGEKILLNATFPAGTFTAAFDGYIQIEQIA